MCRMPRKRLSDGQITFSLRLAESAPLVGNVFRKQGVNEQCFYRLKKLFAEMEVLTMLEPETRARLYDEALTTNADLSHNNWILTANDV